MSGTSGWFDEERLALTQMYDEMGWLDPIEEDDEDNRS
jgi:hypothetical protein